MQLDNEIKQLYSTINTGIITSLSQQQSGK